MKFSIERKQMKSSTPNFFGRAPRVELEVTQAAINDGVARNSNHCMIAEALKAKYPELQYVSVDIQTIRATDKEKRERYVWITPRSVQQHIVDFDIGKKPKPFTVYLRDGQVTKSGTGGSVTTRRRGGKKLRPSRGGTRTTVPERVGGKTPPRSIGQRRSFGMRQLIV